MNYIKYRFNDAKCSQSYCKIFCFIALLYVSEICQDAGIILLVLLIIVDIHYVVTQKKNAMEAGCVFANCG